MSNFYTNPNSLKTIKIVNIEIINNFIKIKGKK